ncbi:MAG: XRE family transcriptional regulator [Sphingobacteriia bacterium]|nr:XRE family transcriptional regulator [Sphingobacteriia bacterium]
MAKMTLKQARIKNDFTQEFVASVMGVNPATIYNWERGARSPDIDKFNLLIDIYGVTYDEIEFPIKKGE